MEKIIENYEKEQSLLFDEMLEATGQTVTVSGVVIEKGGK